MEVEEWNEYGELKQHVAIVGDSNLVKAPVKTKKKKTENTKPVAKPATTVTEIAKDAASSMTAAIPTSISMVMRQAGEQAAQTAKGLKETVANTVGTAGATAPKKYVSAEPSSTFVSKIPSIIVDAPTTLQSFASSAWNRAPGQIPETIKEIGTHESIQSSATSLDTKVDAQESVHSSITDLEKKIDTHEPLQSPTDSVRKSVPHNEEQPFEPPVTQHRGSEVSLASAEEIRNIEASETIKEEDEEAVA